MGMNLLIGLDELKQMCDAFSLEDRGMFMRIIVDYAEGNEIIGKRFESFDDPLMATAIFLNIKPLLDKSITNYKRFMGQRNEGFSLDRSRDC